MGHGKLFMVLIQLTFTKQLYHSDYYYAKLTTHDFEIFLEINLRMPGLQ